MADILAPQFLRQPPASIQMEQWLLGGIMYDPHRLDKVVSFLRPEHFMDPINGELYRIMVARINAGRSVDGMALAEELKTRPMFDPVGGSTYCAKLMEHMCSPLHVEPFARAVADAGLRRAMIDLCETTLDQCYSPPVDSKIGALPDTGEMILERHLEAIDALRGGFLIGRGKLTGDEVMDMAIARAREAEAAGGTVGLSTGMPTIDEIMGGMVPGNLILLAGRPGMGKSACAMQWAVNVAATCRATPDLGGVFVISLEMAGEEIGARMLATQAEVNSATLFRGRMAGHEHRIMQARTDLDALPLLFEAERNLTISQIRAKAREAQRHFKKLALVVIDHLHLVAPEEADERHGPTHSMGKISASAKMMADEFGCPVLALAQLNRGLEAREDKRPNLSDLRQAGSLEQDADIVAFVFRAEYYMSAEAPDRKASEKPDAYDARCRAQREQLANAAGKAEVIFAKLRNGAPGTAHLRWRAETTSFEDGPRTGADEALIPF